MPVHRALTEPILMGGAPRSIAILNGTLAAALGSACACGSRASCFGVGHGRRLGRQARSLFVEVVRRHLRIPGHLNT